MAKKFEIQKQGFGSVAAAYNDLLGIKSESQIVLLPLSQLDEIDDQPFPINESKVEQIADSIENVGVIEPIIVVKNGERYNILSGRHRFRACGTGSGLVRRLARRKFPVMSKKRTIQQHDTF